MDMEQDGVQVRPLRQITGESEFNELFIEEARIPDANMIGGEGKGWAVAITTLMHERATLAFGLQVSVQIAMRELIDTAHETRGENGRVATEDPVVRQHLAQLLIESEVLRLNAYRGLSATMRSGVPGPGGVARQVALVRGQPVADRGGDGDRRAAGDAGQTTNGPTASCGRGPTRSRAARPRSSRTSSPSECSGSRGCADGAKGAEEMNFGFSDDQQAIKRTARDFLAARYPLATVRQLAEDDRGFTDEQWQELVELGWPGVIVPEDRGGLGLGAVELVVIAEEMGYALAPSPLVLDHLRGAAARRGRHRGAARPLARAAGRRGGARHAGRMGRARRAGRPITPRWSQGPTGCSRA